MVLGLVLYAYASTSEVAWLFLIAYWIWLLAGAGLFYQAWNFGGITGGVELSASTPGPHSPVHDLAEPVMRHSPVPGPIFEGDSIVLRVGLGSRKGSRGPARLSGRVAGMDVAAAAAVVPPQGWSEECHLDAVARGPISLGTWVLEAGDPLGLFRRRGRGPTGEVGVAFPVFTSLADHHRSLEAEASVPAPRSGAGTEILGVREYRSGDPLRRIHWRSSARHGELIVREFEPPGLRVLGILLDPEPISAAVADQIARIAASEAWDCIRAGGHAVIWMPGAAATPARHGRSLWALLDWLARYPAFESNFEAPPPSVSDAVAVGGSMTGLEVALAEIRRRGGETRVWLVGGPEPLVPSDGVASDAMVTRVGTEWPL